MSSNDPLKTTIMLMPDIFVSSKPLPHPCNSALGRPNVMLLEKPSLKHPDPSIHLFSVEMLSCSKLAMKTNASFAQAKLNITNIYMKVQISDTKELLFMPATFPKQALAFTCLQNKSYGNTVRKKKMLVTSNFSFTHSVFYPFEELSAIFIKFKIVVYKFFQFGIS